jgi:hypothetical protein
MAGAPRAEDSGIRRRRDDGSQPSKRAKGNRPAKPSGTPVVLLVMLAVGALVLFAIGATGLYLAFFNDRKPVTDATSAGPKSASTTDGAQWHETVDRSGGYRIRFPTRPHATNWGKREWGIQLYSFGNPNEEHFSCWHLPKSIGLLEGSSDEEILAHAEKEFGSMYTVKSRTRIVYQGYPGVEQSSEVTERVRMKSIQRVIVAGDRTIRLEVGGLALTDESRAARTFFESLRID